MISKIINSLPILIAIIIIILASFIKKKHLFWDKQPVMRKKSNSLEIIGNMPNFKFKYKGKGISLDKTTNKDKVYTFLNNNFNNNYNISYPYFCECFNQEDSRNICIYYKKEIIGFIHSEPLNVVYNNKVINFQYVDYLCVDQAHRGKNCASLLIAYLLQSFKNKKTVFLFKRDEVGLPFKPIINSNYFYKNLTKFLPNKIDNVWHIINRREQIDTIYNYYKKLTSRYKVRTFYSKRKFRYIFVDKKILDLFIIENLSGFKTLVIGKKNAYKINNKIENCFEIDLILGELRYSDNINDKLSNILKNNGYNFYCIPNIAHHGKFIKENKLEKSIKLYYYTYNISIPPIKLTEFCMNIN
jgi:hypothetical protein